MSSKFVKKFVGVVIIFTMIFGIKLSFLPISLFKIVLVLLLFWAICRQLFKTPFYIPKSAIYFFLAFLSIGLYSFFITTFRGVDDYGFLSKAIYLIYEPILGGVLVSAYFIKNFRFNFKDILNILLWAVSIQSILTLLSYFSPEVSAMYDTLLPNVGNLSLNDLFRVKGFTNLGGAWLSVMIATGILAGLQLLDGCDGRGKSILIGLQILISISATVVTGRTGMLMGLIFVSIFLIKWLANKKFIKKSIYLFLPIIAITFGIIFLFPTVTDLVSGQTLNWAFEIFTKSDNSFSTASSDELFDMIYLPADASQLIFGVGFYENAIFGYKHSDSGYIKTILSIGIFGALLFYVTYGYLYYEIIKNVIKKNQKANWFVILLVIASIVVEFKEPYLQTVGITNLLFLICFYLVSINISEIATD